MAQKLFDLNGLQIFSTDLSEKGPWHDLGKSHEDVFIRNFGQDLKLIINPEKKRDRYTVGLLNVKTSNLGDLKVFNTPFFLSEDRFGIDAQFAVTLSKGNYLRYIKYYPGIEIYFWVHWYVTRLENKKIIEVDPMKGVWKITLQDLDKIIDVSPLYQNPRRRYDFNYKGVYVLDLRNPLFEKLI